MISEGRKAWLGSLRERDIVAVMSVETGFVGLYRYMMHHPATGDIAVTPLFSPEFNPTDQFERTGNYYSYLKLTLEGFACLADGTPLLRIEPVDESVIQRLSYRFLAKTIAPRSQDRILSDGGDNRVSLRRVRKMALAMEIIRDQPGWKLAINIDEEGRSA